MNTSKKFFLIAACISSLLAPATSRCYTLKTCIGTFNINLPFIGINTVGLAFHYVGNEFRKSANKMTEKIENVENNNCRNCKVSYCGPCSDEITWLESEKKIHSTGCALAHATGGILNLASLYFLSWSSEKEGGEMKMKDVVIEGKNK